MAMDFFQRQADAHRNTQWLVVMFVLAVIGIVTYDDGLPPRCSRRNAGAGRVRRSGHCRHPNPFRGKSRLAAGVAALGLIGGGSLFKIAQLSGGGTVVAERLGGRRVYPNTTDPVERRVLNVVEEMALASGVPVPAVFMLSRGNGHQCVRCRPYPQRRRRRPSRAAVLNSLRATSCRASLPTSSATFLTATCGSICG